ncbi:hypothetical protein Dda_9459 [Drechslerella dactyloides]|uniref:Uncharacterized protein n=1 Tax=Drechslerella dactyloides TaxID=74499 RepID=A0AAD6NF54_DREDA|nr:hypothetical protein Dda_9459 [Drechslerella dactyloides]
MCGWPTQQLEEVQLRPLPYHDRHYDGGRDGGRRRQVSSPVLSGVLASKQIRMRRGRTGRHEGLQDWRRRARRAGDEGGGVEVDR